MEGSRTADGAGVAGNERLTGTVAATLFVLLLVEGVTVVALDATMSVHVFVGAMLIPPALLKVFSTSYRMIRYYTGSAPYVERGVPPLGLRLLGPVVVLATVMVLGSGVVLVAASTGWAKPVHTLGALLFVGATGIHVLAHVWRTPGLAAADWRRSHRLPGGGRRRVAVAVALLVGVGAGTWAVVDGHVRRGRDRGRDEGTPPALPLGARQIVLSRDRPLDRRA